jgi:hypothetical protein
MSTLLPIPALETATDPIGAPADLLQRWRALMGPLGFGERVLWLAFVGADRRMHKILTDMPIAREPSRAAVLDLVTALVTLLAEFDQPTTVAMLLSRPGRDGAGAADRRWAQALTDTARRAGVAIEPIFLATDRTIERI